MDTEQDPEFVTRELILNIYIQRATNGTRPQSRGVVSKCVPRAQRPGHVLLRSLLPLPFYYSKSLFLLK